MLDKILDISVQYEQKQLILQKADAAFMLAYENFLKTLEKVEDQSNIKNEKSAIVDVIENVVDENFIENTIKNTIEEVIEETITEDTQEQITLDIKQKRQSYLIE